MGSAYDIKDTCHNFHDLFIKLLHDIDIERLFIQKLKAFIVHYIQLTAFLRFKGMYSKMYKVSIYVVEFVVSLLQ